MKRKTFLLTSLGALCAAATGKAAGLFTPKLKGSDTLRVISIGTPKILADGREIIGWGVQFQHREGNDFSSNRIERYAICYEVGGTETRNGFARKLRLLADSIETGEGAVLGSNVLTGHELNRADYPAVDEGATEAKYPDFTPQSRLQDLKITHEQADQLIAYAKEHFPSSAA